MSDSPNSRGAGIGAWTPVLAYMALIFAISCQSRIPHPENLLGWDKFQHFVAYMIMGLLIVRAAYRRPALPIGPYWQALIIGTLYGLSDEYHQSFVPGRDMSIADWIADIAGVLFALAVAYVVRLYRTKRRA